MNRKNYHSNKLDTNHFYIVKPFNLEQKHQSIGLWQVIIRTRRFILIPQTNIKNTKKSHIKYS